MTINVISVAGCRRGARMTELAPATVHQRGHTQAAPAATFQPASCDGNEKPVCGRQTGEVVNCAGVRRLVDGRLSVAGEGGVFDEAAIDQHEFTGRLARARAQPVGGVGYVFRLYGFRQRGGRPVCLAPGVELFRAQAVLQPRRLDHARADGIDPYFGTRAREPSQKSSH